MLSGPLINSLHLYRDFKRGDADAVAEVRGMFAADQGCFLCDAPAGDDFDLLTLEDPSAPGESAILAPICTSCMSIPLLPRLHRLRKLLRAMFPKLNPRKIRLIPQAALR